MSRQTDAKHALNTDIGNNQSQVTNQKPASHHLISPAYNNQLQEINDKKMSPFLDLPRTVVKDSNNLAIFDGKFILENQKDEEWVRAQLLVKQGRLEELQRVCHIAYHKYRKSLWAKDGLLFRGDQLVLPKNISEMVLKHAHSGHPGSDKVFSSLRDVWWPNKSLTTTKLIERCQSCFSTGKSLKTIIPKTKHGIHPVLPGPSIELQIDFKGPLPFKNKYICVVIDVGSRWPHAFFCNSPTSANAIKCLKEYFCTHGIPRIIRSDRGTAFTSKEFMQFTNDIEIKQKFAPPNYHKNTGMIERCISSLYSLYLANLKDKLTENGALQKTLFTMRNMENRTTKLTPFEAHFGRMQPNRIRNKLYKPSLDALSWSNVKLKLICLEQEQEQMDNLMEKSSQSGDDSEEILEEVRTKHRRKEVSRFDRMPKNVVNSHPNTVTIQDKGGLFKQVHNSQCAWLPPFFRKMETNEPDPDQNDEDSPSPC